MFCETETTCYYQFLLLLLSLGSSSPNISLSAGAGLGLWVWWGNWCRFKTKDILWGWVSTDQPEWPQGTGWAAPLVLPMVTYGCRSRSVAPRCWGFLPLLPRQKLLLRRSSLLPQRVQKISFALKIHTQKWVSHKPSQLWFRFPFLSSWQKKKYNNNWSNQIVFPLQNTDFQFRSEPMLKCHHFCWFDSKTFFTQSLPEARQWQATALSAAAENSPVPVLHVTRVKQICAGAQCLTAAHRASSSFPRAFLGAARHLFVSCVFSALTKLCNQCFANSDPAIHGITIKMFSLS